MRECFVRQNAQLVGKNNVQCEYDVVLTVVVLAVGERFLKLAKTNNNKNSLGYFTFTTRMCSDDRQDFEPVAASCAYTVDL